MYNLHNLPTTEEFASELATFQQQPFGGDPLAQLRTPDALLRPRIDASQVSNGTNARNPQNANFILGVGHSSIPSNRNAFSLRGLNSADRSASLVMARVPGQNAVTWMVVKGS